MTQNTQGPALTRAPVDVTPHGCEGADMLPSSRQGNCRDWAVRRT